MQSNIVCQEAQALSGSLNPYIGTDNEILDDDEKAFLQTILDDDNRIKAQSRVRTTHLPFTLIDKNLPIL